MKNFISILISFLLMGFADSIDNFFNHAISIDAIVACASLFSIGLILRSIGDIGTYTYRIVRKNEWSYLTINIIICLVLGFVVFFSKSYIVNMFDLTFAQKELVINILSLYVLYLLLDRLSNSLFEITRLRENIKLYQKSLFLFYIILISLDTIVFITTKSLVLLFCSTMFCWLVSIIYISYNLNLKYQFPNKETFYNVYKYGIPMTLERLLSRVFLLIYGVIASHMGTYNYSVHAICYAVCLNLELVTNAYEAALMIELPKYKDYNERYINAMEIKKKYFPLILIINYVMCFLYLFIEHGALPLKDCFPYILLYGSAVFGLYKYETNKVLCITEGKPKTLLFGSLVGVIIRVVICIIFLNSSYNLYVFGIINLIDFFIRGVIFEKVLNKEKIIINNKKIILE